MGLNKRNKIRWHVDEHENYCFIGEQRTEGDGNLTGSLIGVKYYENTLRERLDSIIEEAGEIVKKGNRGFVVKIIGWFEKDSDG